MFVSVAKINRRLEEIGLLRFKEKMAIPQVQAFEAGEEKGELGSPQTLTEGDRWGKPDTIYYLKFEVEIPRSWRGKLVALNLNFSAPGNESLSTAEGLVFIEGKAIHALDRYHRLFILPPELAEKEKLPVEIRIWTGLTDLSHTVHKIELIQIDQGADALYNLMFLALDAARGLAANSATRVAILKTLDETCLKLNFRQDGGPEFYKSCQEAYQLLSSGLDLLARESGAVSAEWQPHITATGHAHIDVAWLWQLAHTRIKAANTFTTALYHMDRYPHFIFTQSQPQLYQFIKEDHPEIYSRIKEKVAKGQWEAEGAMWVEADSNLTGGESLVRQFLFGQRFFRKEFGYTSKVLWLPDAFGFSPVLPQLIKGAGAEYFITTKISWNDTNRLPVDTFWWQGLDGTEVLAYFITAQTEDGFSSTTYNGDMRPYVLARTWEMYQQKDLNRELLLAYGYGDGGGGPTREMIEAAARLSKPFSREIPTGGPGKVAAFMDRLKEKVGNNPDLPHWVGELYLEFHRGTYTSQGKVKRGNRLAERDLHNAELLAALAFSSGGLAYPQESLNQAWKIVLTHQFHDILPGSSIGGVYSDAEKYYAQVSAVTTRVINASQEFLAGRIAASQGSLVVFNTLCWPRDALVELEKSEFTGQNLPSQELENGKVLTLLKALPSLGFQVFPPGKGREIPPENSSNKVSITASPESMESPFYLIELNRKGQITRLLDKQGFGGAGREVIKQGERANVFQLFEDKPVHYDAWNIDDFYEQKTWELDKLVSAEVIEQGFLRAGLKLTWDYEGRTKVIQKIFIYGNSRRIDFVTEVEWAERQTLFKVAFPVEIHSGKATAEVQFGNLERTTHRNTGWDRARYETCAQKWFDLSEGDYGVAVLNDCKYGYDVYGKTLRLTLLKGPISPDPQGDLGPHEFTYSLLPHAGNWFEGEVHKEAYELNYPVLSVIKNGEPGPSLPPGLPGSLSLLEVDRKNVVVETVKKAEDNLGLIVRLYECANQRGPFQLKLSFKAKSVKETNLLEEEIQELELSENGTLIKSEIRPFEVKTFLIS